MQYYKILSLLGFNEWLFDRFFNLTAVTVKQRFTTTNFSTNQRLSRRLSKFEIQMLNIYKKPAIV